jgi:hypothetical protein
VLDGIRGQAVSAALATLQHTPRAAARLIEKVLRSAIANAEHHYQVRDLDALRVLRIGVSDEVAGAPPVPVSERTRSRRRQPEAPAPRARSSSASPVRRRA